MTPQSVGIKASNLVLGKHSGRHALSDRIKELGFELNDVELNQVFKEFKRLADIKKQIFDEDLEALVTHGSEAHGSIPTGTVEHHLWNIGDSNCDSDHEDRW